MKEERSMQSVISWTEKAIVSELSMQTFTSDAFCCRAQRSPLPYFTERPGGFSETLSISDKMVLLLLMSSIESVRTLCGFLFAWSLAFRSISTWILHSITQPVVARRYSLLVSRISTPGFSIDSKRRKSWTAQWLFHHLKARNPKRERTALENRDPKREWTDSGYRAWVELVARRECL